jgi:hypothetical protein
MSTIGLPSTCKVEKAAILVAFAGLARFLLTFSVTAPSRVLRFARLARSETSRYRNAIWHRFDEASWRSGDVADCKSAHPGSIPGEASNFHKCH